jgi:hypothetical protein
MKKLHRLIKNCMDQMNTKTGTAETFNDALSNLGRWVLTLYTKGNLANEVKFLEQDESKKFKNLIKYFGEKAEIAGGWDTKENMFIDRLTLCHSKLSDIYELYKEGCIPSYIYFKNSKEPSGIPLAFADLTVEILILCYHYDIDIDKILSDKLEEMK